MEDYKKALVQRFLIDYKAATNQSFTLIPRKENMDTLQELELTVQDCRNEILELSIGDYHKGPEDDKDKAKGGTVWFFGKSIKGREIYIKIKLIQTENLKHAVCLSFHFAEKSLDYPLRQK